MYVITLLGQTGSSPGILLDYLSRASVVTFLILVVYGGYKKWWVWGWLYNEKTDEIENLRKESNAWRETALKGANVATQAFDQIRELNKP